MTATPAKHDIEPPSYNRWTVATMPKALLALGYALVAIVVTYLKAPGWPGAWVAIGALLTALGVYLVSNDRFPYAKLAVAALGAVFQALAPFIANDWHLNPDQLLLALGAVAAALGVYVLPNQPPFRIDTPFADPAAHSTAA